MTSNLLQQLRLLGYQVNCQYRGTFAETLWIQVTFDGTTLLELVAPESEAIAACKDKLALLG